MYACTSWSDRCTTCPTTSNALRRRKVERCERLIERRSDQAAGALGDPRLPLGDASIEGHLGDLCETLGRFLFQPDPDMQRGTPMSTDPNHLIVIERLDFPSQPARLTGGPVDTLK